MRTKTRKNNIELAGVSWDIMRPKFATKQQREAYEEHQRITELGNRMMTNAMLRAPKKMGVQPSKWSKLLKDTDAKWR